VSDLFKKEATTTIRWMIVCWLARLGILRHAIAASADLGGIVCGRVRNSCAVMGWGQLFGDWTLIITGPPSRLAQGHGLA
jgi:hypothetical protein